MNYNVSKYPAGTFSWADFFSTDIEASKKFYTTLFGWTYEDMPTGEGRPDYTMFSLNGRYTAGGSPAFDPTMPSYWSNYVSVDDVDAIAMKAVELGGKVIMEPMDVLDSGRMATIQDPTGAIVSIWYPRNHVGAGIVNTVGAMCWNELYTNDVDKAKQFYGELFGWTFETDETGYTTIMNNGRANGGIFKITPEMGSMPPFWLPYFTVANIEQSLDTVKQHGGGTDMDIKEIGVGKIVMVADPAGAWIMLMEMSVQPEEWTE